nr:gibberellin 2-beta-dioxygenase 1 [Tanacetum cinerariifolium]
MYRHVIIRDMWVRLIPYEDYAIKVTLGPYSLECLRRTYSKIEFRLPHETNRLMADGLKIDPRSLLSKLSGDDKADRVFWLKHYPPYLVH